MIRHKYEYFITFPGEAEQIRCPACGTFCRVRRNVWQDRAKFYGSKRLRGEGLRDHWECPRLGEAWHKTALKLVLEMEDTASERVRNLIFRDLRKLLAEQGIQNEEGWDPLALPDIDW